MAQASSRGAPPHVKLAIEALDREGLLEVLLLLDIPWEDIPEDDDVECKRQRIFDWLAGDFAGD